MEGEVDEARITEILNRLDILLSLFSEFSFFLHLRQDCLEFPVQKKANIIKDDSARIKPFLNNFHFSDTLGRGQCSPKVPASAGHNVPKKSSLP